MQYLYMRGLSPFTLEALISAWELLFLPVVLGLWSPYLMHLRGKFILRALLGHRLWVP